MAGPNRDALADTLIADILTPYLLYSHPKLIQTIGRESLACAQRLYREVGRICAHDDKARRTLELFEEDPETYSSAFGLVLQRLFAQDESWAQTIQQHVIVFSTSTKGDSNVAGSGAMAANGGTAAGERGVAVKGSVEGGIHIYGASPLAPVKDMTEPEQLHWQKQASYLSEATQAYATLLRANIEKVFEHPRVPYKNLFYYELSDEGIFFGREEATQRFLDQIRGWGKTRRLTVLHASSGAGKTSLINAGITPALLRAGDVTLYALARIGTEYKDPAAAIRKRIVDAAPADRPQPDLSGLSLHNFLRLATIGLDGQQLIIFLDQFEEFFIHLSPEARTPFINELAACYDDEALLVKFVISIRKDYFSDLSELETAIPAVFYNQFRLNPLTRIQAADAITKPVAPFGIHYTDDLIETLLDDLESSGMELPHLQLICSRLYETQQRNVITLNDYEALGRAEGILGGYLVSFMDQFGPLKSVAQAVLVEMVTSEDTKRVMSRAELGIRVGEEYLDDVLTRLVAGRLLRRDEEGGIVRYEMSHEYLIREIATWISVETRERKQAEELLTQEVYAWKQFGTLTGPDKLDIIAAQQEHIHFTPEAQELLLRSALANGHDLALWPGLVSDARLRKEILDEFTVEPRAAVRAHAAWTWSKLDEPASIPTLIKLALEDTSPIVTAAAGEALLRLERQRDGAMRELISIARSGDRVNRGSALAILTRVPLEGLEPGLRWRITMTRLRLGLNSLYNRLIPQPYRQVVIATVLILLLVLSLVYGFLASSAYLDVLTGSTSGNDGLIIVRNGHPMLQSWPGFDQPIIETDFWLDDVKSEEKEKLSGGQIVTFKWQEGTTNYDLWAEEVLTLLSPTDLAYYGWYLGDSPEKAVENLLVAISVTENDSGLALATLEQVVTSVNNPVITQQAIDSLAGLVNDQDSKLRTVGIVALSHVVTPNTNRDTVDQVISDIEPLLKDDSTDVRTTALEAIRHIMVVAQDTDISQRAIKIFIEHLSRERRGTLDYSQFQLWLETIIALDEPATTKDALENLFNLEDVMQSNDNSYAFSNLLYQLPDIIRTADDKAIAADTVAVVKPLLDSQDESTFWPTNDILRAASDKDPEVAEQVVEILSPSLTTQDVDRLQSVIGFLAHAVSKTDDPSIAKGVYGSLIPLLEHEDRKVRLAVTRGLAQVAAKTDDQDILRQSLDIMIGLADDEDLDGDIRLAALEGIGVIIEKGDHEVAEQGVNILLSKVKNEEDPEIREAAIFGLSSAVDNQHIYERVFYKLSTLARDDLVDNRLSAGSALGNIIRTTDSPLTVRRAISVTSILLKDPEPIVRFAAEDELVPYFYYGPDIDINTKVAGELIASFASLLEQDDPYKGQIMARLLDVFTENISYYSGSNGLIKC